MRNRRNFIALTIGLGLLAFGCSDDDPAPTGSTGTGPSANDLGWDWTGEEEVLSLDSSTGRFQHFTTGFDDIGAGTWTIEGGTLTLNYEEGDDFFISGVIVLTASLNGTTLTLTQQCDDIMLDDADNQEASVAECRSNPTSTWTR